MAGECLYYTMYIQGNSNQISKYAYLIIYNNKKSIVTNVRLEIRNNLSYGSVFLPDTLSTGLYRIDCYTNLMRNPGGTFFNKEIVIANRFDGNPTIYKERDIINGTGKTVTKTSTINDSEENIKINLKKLVYSSGEKISFSIELNNSPLEKISSLSVSVSEFLPGAPAEPSISEYFGEKSEDISADKYISPLYRYMPEFEQTVLQGRVIKIPMLGNNPESTDDAHPDNKNQYTVFLSTPDSIANLQYSKTDSLGSFGFHLNQYYEGKELVIKLKEKTDAIIELDDKTNHDPIFIQSMDYDFEGLKEFLIRSGKIAQVQKFYYQRHFVDTLYYVSHKVNIPKAYFKSYTKTYPADYIELPDFVEISREILPSFKVRKSNDKYVSEFSNIRDQLYKKEEPLIFLDGVPIDDVNQIIKLGSKDIRCIESVAKIRYYGGLSFNGILAVVSYKNEIADIQFKTPATKYKSTLSQPFTKPEKFNPENLTDHLPDLRQVLYWVPDVKPDSLIDGTIDCYASDLKGQYRINIQGILLNGEPVNGSAIITVE